MIEDSQEGKGNAAKAMSRYLLAHPALSLTLAAVLLNFIGLTASFFSLYFYEINFFDFADIDDFVVGAFRNPGMLFYGVVAVAFFPWALRKFANHRVGFFTMIYTLAAIVLLPAAWGYWDAAYPDAIAIFSKRYSEVYYKNGRTGAESITKIAQVRIISNPGDFLIFINDDGDVSIIHRSAIVRIYERN